MPTQDTTASMHVCALCGQATPEAKLDRPHRCRKCANAYKLAWARANAEKVRQQKKAYEERYPERVAASKEKNRELHGERYKQIQSAWKSANRELVNQRNREAYRRNPEPFAIRNKRREERECTLPGTFTKADRLLLLNQQNWECNGCGRPIDESAHADHKTPVVRGGSNSIENRQMLCKRCNHLKGTMTQEEWMMRRAS